MRKIYLVFGKENTDTGGGEEEEGEVCRHWARAKMHAAAWPKAADQ